MPSDKNGARNSHLGSADLRSNERQRNSGCTRPGNNSFREEEPVAEIPIERKPRSHVGLILLIVLLIIVAACAYWWWTNQNGTAATPATGLRTPAAMVVAVRDFYMVGV